MHFIAKNKKKVIAKYGVPNVCTDKWACFPIDPAALSKPQINHFGTARALSRSGETINPITSAPDRFTGLTLFIFYVFNISFFLGDPFATCSPKPADTSKRPPFSRPFPVAGHASYILIFFDLFFSTTTPAKICTKKKK